MIDVKQVQDRLWANKERQGFNTTDVKWELLCIYEELAELSEAWRKDLPNKGEEVADILLYLCSIAKMLDVDVEAELEAKMAKNEARVYRKSGQGHVRVDKSEGGN